MEQIYIPKKDYQVLVNCMTYNQSKYIEDALNGFAMQQTSFPFVCLVMDDYSSDGEQDVINAWIKRECDMSRAEYVDLELANVILVPHKTNYNCNFAVYLLKKNLYKSKDLKFSMVKPWSDLCVYEALCEGDDFWTTTCKLQMQYDYLQQHPEYTAIASNSNVVNECGSFLRKFSKKHSRDISQVKELTLSRCFHTASILYRRKSYYESIKYNPLNTWDTWRWCSLVVMGPIRYQETVTCVYRKGVGVTSSASTFNWIVINKKWCDTLVEAFCPEYVQTYEIYNETLCDIIKCLICDKQLSLEERTTLKNYFFEMFSYRNLFSLINNSFLFITSEMAHKLPVSLRQTLKKILFRK